MTFKKEIEKILWDVINECIKKEPNFSWDTLLDKMSQKLADTFDEKMPTIELQRKMDQIKAIMES